MNESEETEEMTTFPLYLYLQQGDHTFLAIKFPDFSLIFP